MLLKSAANSHIEVRYSRTTNETETLSEGKYKFKK